MTALATVLLACWRCAAAQDLPHVTQAHLEPQFWLARIPRSGEVMLTSKAINKINKNIYRKGYRVHPCYEHYRVAGERVRKFLDQDLEGLTHWRKYDKNNRRLRDPHFSNLMKARLAQASIPQTIKVRYGLTVIETPVRVMPTDMLLQRKPDEPDFDILQHAMLDLGQPVAGYHLSTDKQWIYVQSPLCRGWAKRAHIGWAREKKVVEDFMKSTSFLMMTGKSITVYRDPDLARPAGTIGMGNRIPLNRKAGRLYEVRLPRRSPTGRLLIQRGYIPAEAKVHRGYLDFTADNVAVQAFKWLGESYGWGGTGKQVDCSRFVMNVLGTFGFELPRTSHLQIKSFARKEFSAALPEKKRQLQSLPALGALLQFPGHIGLYLGQAGGRHYVIHSLGAYYEREDGQDVERRVKRVIVSDLSLGAGGKRGSLFERAEAAGIIW